MSALSPATRAVLDAMCDGNAHTLAVMRHACLEVRDVLDALKARLAAAEARAERAVGMVRRAYSIGYSAGCAGAPHSVRVDDLAALLKEVSGG